MRTFTEQEIEGVKDLCNRAFEICERRSAFHKLGKKPSGQHTLDGVVVDIPMEKLESIKNSNTALLDAELLGVLNRFGYYADRDDCKGKKNMDRKTDVVSNEISRDVFFSQLKMRIYKAIAMLGLPLYVVKDIKEAREKVWIEIAKECVCFSRAEFDLALESVIEESCQISKIEEDIASGNKDPIEVVALKQGIKSRFKKMKHTPLKFLTDKDLLRDFWLELRVLHGTSRELFEKTLIECLHEEYGYSIESLKAMKATTETK